VNGDESITLGANQYQLEENDELVWFFTWNYTSEPGSSAWNDDKDEDDNDGAGHGMSFKDISEDDWYYDAVSEVTGLGIFNGESEDSFGAGSDMTRAMFVTVLGRLFELGGNTASGSSTGIFSDAPEGSYYSQYVEWAAETGIGSGYGGDTFGAGDSITREQIAVFMYRYAGFIGLDLTGSADLNTFPDAEETSQWATGAMEWAIGTGLINGRDDGTLDPSGNATRAETAVIIFRFLSLLEDLRV
jgi:hypothetical protein